jgi:microsomal dipeptidase-like Zn-dependent dipeptidase
VMLAEDSPLLCSHVNNDGRACSDEGGTILRQINEAWAMQRAVDAQFGEGQGWYRIVRTPAEARQVIASGRLAVVLGIETVHPPGATDLDGLIWLHDLGVRHIFPIHQSDNDFGGASYFEPILQRQRNVFADQFFHGLGPLFGSQAYEMDTEDCAYEKTHRCNMNGLSFYGKNALRGLMQAAMVIDTDHMSDKSFADALTIAEELGYPMVAGHAGFNDIDRQAQSHEGQLTSGEYQRITDSGGLVGLITGQGMRLGDVATYERPGMHQVDHICGRTSETFAQAYYYAIDHAPGHAVALGSDFNAPLLQPGARFGQWSCPGGQDFGRAKWQASLNYPFLARGSGRPDRAPSTSTHRDWPR